MLISWRSYTKPAELYLETVLKGGFLYDLFEKIFTGKTFVSLLRTGLCPDGGILGGLVLASSAAAFTVIAHQVTGEESWTKEGSPYIICKGAGVAADATLTIEDGVEVQLGYGTVWVGETKYSVSPTFSVAGDLSATGTMFTPFTGSGSTGEWGAIRFVDGSSGTFTNCTFVYGGEGAATYSMVMVDDHTANVRLTFSDCIFKKGLKAFL